MEGSISSEGAPRPSDILERTAGLMARAGELADEEDIDGAVRTSGDTALFLRSHQSPEEPETDAQLARVMEQHRSYSDRAAAKRAARL
jgi:hypothetical protein